jgi:hypothetical protein
MIKGKKWVVGGKELQHLFLEEKKSSAITNRSPRI